MHGKMFEQGTLSMEQERPGVPRPVRAGGLSPHAAHRRARQCNNAVLLNAGSSGWNRAITREKARAWGRAGPPPPSPPGTARRPRCRLTGPGPAGGAQPPPLGPAPHERRLGDAQPRCPDPSPRTPPQGCPAALAGPAHHERRLRDAERATLPARRCRRLAASGRRHLGTDGACAACATGVIASAPSGRGHRPLAQQGEEAGQEGKAPAGRGKLRSGGEGQAPLCRGRVRCERAGSGREGQALLCRGRVRCERAGSGSGGCLGWPGLWAPCLPYPRKEMPPSHPLLLPAEEAPLFLNAAWQAKHSKHEQCLWQSTITISKGSPVMPALRSHAQAAPSPCPRSRLAAARPSPQLIAAARASALRWRPTRMN